jgi:hypothetical protein
MIAIILNFLIPEDNAVVTDEAEKAKDDFEAEA